MGKVNAKGRTKNRQYIYLHRGVTDSPAWKSLNCEARSLLIEIWQRHNGMNNGRIALSRRQIREALRIGHAKIVTATDQLVDRGFIIVRQAGAFTWKDGARAGKATEFEITTEECDGKPAKSTFRDWRPKKESTVHASGATGSRLGNRQAEKNHKLTSDRYRGVNEEQRFSAADGYRGVNTYNIPYTSDLLMPQVELVEGAPKVGGRLVRRVYTRVLRAGDGRAAANLKCISSLQENA